MKPLNNDSLRRNVLSARRLVAGLGLACLLTLTACDEGAAEEAGEELDHMMHEAEEAAEEAVDEVEKAIDDADDGVNG